MRVLLCATAICACQAAAGHPVSTRLRVRGGTSAPGAAASGKATPRSLPPDLPWSRVPADRSSFQFSGLWQQRQLDTRKATRATKVEWPLFGFAGGRAIIGNGVSVRFLERESGRLVKEVRGLGASVIAGSDLVLIEREGGTARTCELEAYDARRLEIRWRATLPGAFECGDDRREFAATSAGETVLIAGLASRTTIDAAEAVATPTTLVALDARGGALLWQMPFGPPLIEALASDGRRAFLASHEQVLAVDAASGRSLWRRDEGFSRTSGMGGVLTLGGGDVFVSMNGLIRRFDGATGNVKWERSLASGVIVQLLAQGFVLYAVGQANQFSGALYALDMVTGAALWAQSGFNLNAFGAWQGGLLLSSDVVEQPRDGTLLRELRLIASDGATLARMRLAHEFFGPVIADADGFVLAYAEFATLTGFRLRSRSTGEQTSFVRGTLEGCYQGCRRLAGITVSVTSSVSEKSVSIVTNANGEFEAPIPIGQLHRITLDRASIEAIRTRVQPVHAAVPSPTGGLMRCVPEALDAVLAITKRPVSAKLLVECYEISEPL